MFMTVHFIMNSVWVKKKRIVCVLSVVCKSDLTNSHSGEVSVILRHQY